MLLSPLWVEDNSSEAKNLWLEGQSLPASCYIILRELDYSEVLSLPHSLVVCSRRGAPRLWLTWQTHKELIIPTQLFFFFFSRPPTTVGLLPSHRFHLKSKTNSLIIMGNFNRLNMWRPFVVVWSLKMLANGISVHHIFPFTYIVCKLVALFMLSMSVVVWLRRLKICCRSLSSVFQAQLLFHAFCFCALFLLLSPSVQAPSALCVTTRYLSDLSQIC